MKKSKLFFFLLTFVFNLLTFNLCLAARSVCEMDTTTWGCENDQEVLDSKCSIAHLTHTQQGAQRAVESLNSVQKACANRGSGSAYSERQLIDTQKELDDIGIDSGGDICSVSPQELVNRIAADYLDMCGLITDENQPFVCDDPSNFTPREPELRSNCPCPGGVEVFVSGCDIIFHCKIGGDNDATVTVVSPCPTVRGSDPQYPLVKMLSGTLVEWNEPAMVMRNTLDVSWGASGGAGAPGDYYGASYYNGVTYDVVVSSIDMGQGVRFDVGAANAKKNAKNPLDRKNIQYALVGGNPNVEVLTQRDIYNAYKNRSKYVQAYTVLDGKGYRERPWGTYEKFIDAMCNMSSDKTRCKKELAYNGHRDTEMDGNLYLGNGNMSIIGLYSDISSHGCHGATVINEKGEPAFGIEIESTWCFYVHAKWGDYSNWLITECNLIRTCCVDVLVTWTTHEYECNPHDCDEHNQNCKHDTCKEDIPDFQCIRTAGHYELNEDWVSSGGGESTGDCGQCATGKGYVDLKGNYSDKPYPISFYQSQPLLINK